MAAVPHRGFGDAGQISDWAQEAVAAVAAHGYIAGDSSGNVNASKTITRAEFAQMMDNLVKGYPANQSDSGVIEGNAVMRAGSSLSGMTIKGDLILADGLSKNDVDLSTCTIEGRIIVRGGSQVMLSGSTQTSGVVAAASVSLSNNTGSKLASVLVVGNSADVMLSGKIGKVDIKADNVTVNASSNAKIDSVETAASGTTIRGNGNVAAVNVKSGASDTKVTTSKTDITVDSGAGTVNSTNGTLSAGETGTTNNPGALQAGGSKPSSPSSNNSGNHRPSTGSGSSSAKRDDVTADNGQWVGTFDRGTVLTIDPNNGASTYTVVVNGTTRLDTPANPDYTFSGWTVSGTTITAQWTKNETPKPQTADVKDSTGTRIGSFDIGDVLAIDYDNETYSGKEHPCI